MAHDVEFRTREIIQEAGKFMMHSRRAKLTVNDVNMALEAKNVDVIIILSPLIDDIRLETVGI